MANTLNLGTDGNWGVKKDSLLGYNSENGNFKPLPFDFTRASSATVVNKAGLIETVGSGEPRIDFLGNTKGALKLEPQRTNLITYSEAFDNAYWTKSGASVVSDAAISPDGSLNAFKLVESATNAVHRINSPFAGITTATPHTFKVYAKAGESSKIGFRENASTANYATFDLSLGTVLDSDGLTTSIKEVSNNWYEISYTFTSGSSEIMAIYVLSDSYTTGSPELAYLGDGSSGLYIYGAQLEQGSYATSYIPTQGSAVTRLADVCSQTPPDGIIGQTEGVLFFDGYYGDEVSEIYLFTQSSTGTGVSDSMYLQKSGASSLKFIGRDASATTQWDITGGSFSIGQKIKVAAAYKNNDVVLYINGLQIGADLVALIPTMSNVKIGGYPSQPSVSNYFLSKPVNDVKLYNTRLSNSELQQLTTI